MHSDLGRIANEIVQEMRRSIAQVTRGSMTSQGIGIETSNGIGGLNNPPPTPYQAQAQYGYPRVTSPSSISTYPARSSVTTSPSPPSSAQNPSTGTSSKVSQRSLPNTQIPVIPAVFTELEELSYVYYPKINCIFIEISMDNCLG